MNFIPALNPNTLIILVIAVVALYGVVLGQGRLRMLVLSTFVGIVLASQLGGVAHGYLASLPESDVRLALFVLPILLFGVLHRSAHKGGTDHGVFLVNLISGILAGALVVSATLYILPPQDMINIIGGSLFATELANFRLLILAVAPASLLLGLVIKSHDKHH